MQNSFFPPRPASQPRIYAYSDNHPEKKGLLKVGYTTGNALNRVRQQYGVIQITQTWRIEVDESALRTDGSSFTDRQVHALLRKQGVLNPIGEWFVCTDEQVRAAVEALRIGTVFDLARTQSFGLRPEQAAAVEKTKGYFESFAAEEGNEGKVPKFLWNAKMRFGKTFGAYKLAEAMGWSKILVITFKPAVVSAWSEDLATHTDFDGWQFITRGGLNFDDADKNRPRVCFGSFQDFLGKNAAGGIKVKNEWLHATHWDCVILDEYHYGAWRQNAKDLFEGEEGDSMELGEGMELFKIDLSAKEKKENAPEYEVDAISFPITSKTFLYLSGTPFRAIASGEFIEEQIYNWTYSDEQRAKAEWTEPNNPYASLPRMVMMTYQMPDSIKEVATGGEYNEFDLNTFFEPIGIGATARFLHENEVQKWLDLIRGSFAESTLDTLKQGTEKPPWPFSDARLLGLLSHTFWFLPNVASCFAMQNLLAQRQNTFYHEYKVVVAAGNAAGMGADALAPVYRAMGNSLTTKTITLSCGKLTTGVSVRPWQGILMLRNCSSPETYFQAAFRVQTPWTVSNPEGTDPDKVEILKQECYVFDFAPNRALRQIADYSCRLNVDEDNPETKVAEFVKFLPVLAYDGSSMKEIDAAGILDMAMSGTTATLLARRWESALLVNVDNATLARIMANEEAMRALMNIEGFRTLNKDIETIINKSEKVSNAKKEARDRALTKAEKKELTEDEKKYKSLRKTIQEKLIKFATRIPVFMYLTDNRERTLKDVIQQLEPDLFKKVTGLNVCDFNLLVSLNVFNSSLMNDAVYKFKRYEDASLAYTGVNRHEGEAVGLFDTVINASELEGI